MNDIEQIANEAFHQEELIYKAHRIYCNESLESIKEMLRAYTNETGLTLIEAVRYVERGFDLLQYKK